ncbi:hypothetical protein [Micromonospora sp. NPDC023644]|uniref:hypothetical protein n=1 Tax=Micromonospora sp. NPDC023644 TaxID=3154321 RepID=UPI00340334E7
MTPVMAATSANAPEMSKVLFAGIALIVAIGYAGACYVKPFTACHRCKGSGTAPPTWWQRLRRRAVNPRALRGRPDCRRCSGTGLRLRIGRRVFNHFRRLRRQGTR